MVFLAAIVLAGGQSTRMGHDKALIAIDGIPLLRRVYDAALECTPNVYVITFHPERYRAVLPPTCPIIQEQALPGETKPHGPLVGFAQALESVQTDWVLLLACDMPNLSGETLQRWVQELDHVGSAIALLPKAQKGWEALCGFYRTSCLTSLQAAIARGDRSFQRWLIHESVKELLIDNAQVLFNCNTPGDLAKLRERRESFELT